MSIEEVVRHIEFRLAKLGQLLKPIIAVMGLSYEHIQHRLDTVR